MKNKIFILFVLLASFQQMSARFVMKAEAYALIQGFVNTQTMNVYYSWVYQSQLPSEVQTTGMHWGFLVDEEPLKGWAHNCSHYYVPMNIDDNATLTYTKITSTMPRADLTWNVQQCYTNPAGAREFLDLDTIALNQQQTNMIGHVYAVILSGGYSKFANYVRYWNDCSFIYQTLTRKYGVPKDNISVLMADGTDPAADMRIGNMQYISSPVDLDGDNVADIQYAATKANLTSVLNQLSQSLTAQDHLLFFVTDHGGTTDYNTHSYIYLWGGDTITDAELATLMQPFQCRYINFVMGQCYSGGFIDNLRGYNRVISTACSGVEPSWSMSNLLYDEYLYHWTSAMNEAAPNGTTVFADSLSDGLVSMYEAHRYAKTADTRNEYPQYESSGRYENGNIITHEKIGKRSFLRIYSPEYDLMIRDFSGDVGLEPSLTPDTWSSPDICQRQQMDGIYEHQTVQITNLYQQMYTYVKVTNVGESAYPGDNSMHIHLYWSNAIAGISLPGWLGNTTYNGAPAGGKCCTIPVNVPIPAGGSAWIPVVWTINYSVAQTVINNGGYFHLCLLARLSDSSIDDDQSAMMSCIYDFQTDVSGDRRIAQVNINIFSNSLMASQGMPLLVTNVQGQEREYSLEVIPNEGDDSSLRHLEVAMELSEPLYKAWERGGCAAQRVTTYGNHPRKFYAQGGESKICGLKLDSAQVADMRCSASVIADEDVTERRVYSYNIVQRDKLTGEIVGGERIQIVQEPRSAIQPKVEMLTDGKRCTLRETKVSEPARYIWLDEKGMQVAEGKEVTLTAQKARKEYTLRVEAEKDGAVNYAHVTVNSQQGIKSLSPLPFDNQLTVHLLTPAAKDTKIQIVPITSSGLTEEYQVKEGESSVTIYAAHLAKGIYIVSLLNENVNVDSKRVVKQ